MTNNNKTINSAHSKINCETPTPGKQVVAIDKWKYQLIKAAILKLVPRQGEGFLFKELAKEVKQQLNSEQLEKLGSVSWYTTVVKLDLEVKDKLSRVPGSTPQRLLQR